mmetsp:Transcript_60321/g.197374  ORF Transcript_60321/g.197374 Transcript_60321/m.197374 type:complete len:382 (-) Transcript_60321:318-1463(-)
MASSALAAGMAIGTVDFASKDSAVDAVKTTMSRMICEEEQSIQALEDLLKEIQAMKHADPSSASFGEASTPSNFDEMSDTEEVDSVEQREQQLLAAQSRQQELETHARELWRQLEHVEDVLRASEESLEQAGVDRDIAEARAHAYREEVEEARGTVEATFRERTLSMQRQIDALQARLQELQRAAQRSAEPAVLPQTPPTASKQRSASVQAVQTQPKVTMRTLSDGFRIDAFPTIASPQVGRPLVAGPFTKMALPVPRAWQSPFQGRCNVGRHARTVSHNTRRDLQIPEAPGSALSAALISAQHKWPRHRQQPPIRNDRDTPLSPTMPTQHLVLTPRGLGHGAVPPKPTEGGPSCLPTAGAALGPTLAALPGSRSGLLVHL